MSTDKHSDQVTLHTNYGDITIELNHEKAPKTAANFQQYVQDGFYDGTIFHRVISNFMVQGGGMTPDMQQKPTRDPIENEADNGLGNVVGSVAMARTNDPHSASAQFFINVQDNSFLNHRDKSMQGWGYCVFGKVVSGMDAIGKIKAVQTGSQAGHQDVPMEPIVIEKATVSE